jgi:hypothetical protein
MAVERNGTLNGHSATNGTTNGMRPKVLQLGVIEQ